MAATTKQSLDQIINQMLLLHRNSLEIYRKLALSLNTNLESVTVDNMNEDGVIEKISIPSFGYLKSELERMDLNVKALANLDENGSRIRLADGSFRKIIQSKLDKVPNSINELETVSTFDIDSNWFFDTFINPLMKVRLNLTNKIDYDVSKILVNRFILNLDTDFKVSHFDLNYKGKKDIQFSAFINDMQNLGIGYYVDERVIDVSYKERMYYGDFSIIKMYDEQVVNSNGNTIENSKIRKYRLNKLTYSNKSSSQTDTESLKLNDFLIATRDNKTTRFQIVSIDTSTNTISLKRMEGYTQLKVGVNELEIYFDSDAVNSVEIPIGFNQRNIVFLKSIDDTQLISDNWSFGTAFYSNELLINNNGSIEDLDTYYKNEVADFGQYFVGLMKDVSPPASYGIKPDAPILDVSNFKVVEINTHLTKDASIENIKALQTEKTKLQSELTAVEKSIEILRNLTSTKKYNSNIDRQSDEEQLNTLESQRNSKIQLLESIVAKIATSKNSSSAKASPKYRVRGFWPIPLGKASVYTATQEIISFYIDYRYLSKSGNPAPTEQLKFMDGNNQKIGSFSAWNTIQTYVRKKVYDETTGKYSWDTEDVSDSEVNNINQLDIPISEGEIVEIRIKSISEAGYPNNPLVSDFSSTIQVAFPDDLENREDSISEIVEQSKQEEIKLKTQTYIRSLGVEKHISDSFTSNEYYYAHDAKNIASGFLSNEQKPIGLFDKLNELNLLISQLQETVVSIDNIPKISLIDEDGNIYPIGNDTKQRIFAGYYKDIVATLNVQKGVIVTKTYFLRIENANASDLQLKSKAPGSYLDSNGNLSFFVYNDPTGLEKYSSVPFVNLDDTIENTNGIFQSMQNKGQFVYFRYKDLTNSDSAIYKDSSGLSESDVYNYPSAGVSGVNLDNFIWDGNSYVGSPNGVDTLSNDFGIHINHPLLNGLAINDVNFDKKQFGHSKLAILDSSGNNPDRLKQWTFNDNFPIKSAFRESDQYLLGKKSCGAYLFPMLKDRKSITVDGNTINAVKTLKNGESNSINIPIIFQFRMSDYYGSGDTGIGNIGGDVNNQIDNIVYTKILGFDILTKNGEQFSADIEFYAKYKPSGPTLQNIPSVNIDNTKITKINVQL